MKLSKKFLKKSKFIGLSLLILLLSGAVAVSLPSTVHLAQASVFSVNLPNQKILANPPSEVAGIEKIIQLPVSKGIVPPIVTANAVMVQDLDTGMVLYSKNPDQKVPIASTTKIMTALIGTNFYKPNSVLTASASAYVDGSSMGLRPGEQLSFRSVLYGMLLNSGNDAAFDIAENYPGGVSAFVAQMNQEAKDLGLQNTHFDNPAGFDSPNHYSSAADLSKIAIVAEGNSQIARVVSTKETEVASLDKTTVHNLKNLNRLLDLPGVFGMKTGTTPAAKENLVGLIERDSHRIITVVLGSDDRFGDTEKLMNWTFSDYSWPH